MTKSWKIVFGVVLVLVVFSVQSLGDDPGQSATSQHDESVADSPPAASLRDENDASVSKVAVKSNQVLRISGIQTAGNYRLGDSEVLSKVRSRVGEVFDPELAGKDSERIAQLEGVEHSYYSSEIVEGKIQLTFVVVEQNLIRLIRFDGNKKFTNKKLKATAGIKIGDYLDPVLAQRAVEKLVDYYHKKGYAFVGIALADEKLSLGEVVYKIDEGPRTKVRSVQLTGNKQIETKKLKKALKTRKTKWVFMPAYYKEGNIEKDLTKLQNVYYERGFLDATIEVEKTLSANKKDAHIGFVINEGHVYTVNTINIVGVSHFEQSELREKLKLAPEQVYSDKKVQFDTKQIQKLYRENGFIETNVERNVKFLGGAKVDVELAVTEGDRFRIGQINISGNEQTQDKVIRRILDEYDFQPGQWYNADMAQGDGEGYLEKLIQRTALTESTTILPTGTAAGQKDALVNVVEGRTGSVMLGAGVASDSGLIGQLVFEQRNFDITDKPESFTEFITGNAFRGAGQTFRISLNPGTEVSTYSVSFIEPYLNNRPIALSMSASSYERWRESYDEGRMRGNFGLEKRYKSKWRRSASFRIEDVDVTDLDIDAPKEIRDVKGGNMIAGLRLGVGRDLSNDKFNPSKGSIFDAGYEQVAGDHTFGILSTTYRRFKTLYEDLAERKTILATKLSGAAIIGNAPPFEKFYAGGQGSMRGFDYRGVSTRGLQTNVATPERKDPVGSDWLILAGAEIIKPLVADNFAAFFFVDSGAIDSGNFRAAVGAGIQIMIPQWFGPVPMRFELAAPLMKDSEDETQTFSFSIGRLF